MTDPKAELSLREIDAAIAEKVMGWQLNSGERYWCRPPEMSAQHEVLDWSPTTDIAQAFEVLEVMRKTGLIWEVRAARDGKFYACIYKGQYEKPGLVKSEELPLAICKAALAAAEGQAGE